MYNPGHFAETRLEELHSFIRAHPLGAIVTNGADGPEASHVPLFLDRSEGGVRLRCHLARANSHWRRFESAGRLLVIFADGGHYISPNWYASKREHGKVVPTWNYVAVHASGTARLFEDSPSLLRHLNEMTELQESRFPDGWSVSDAPEAYIETMTKAIVGVEITVDRLEGKWKVSQNRSAADRQSVVDALHELASPAAVEMADLITSRKPGS